MAARFIPNPAPSLMSSAGLYQSLSQQQTLAPQMRQSLEVLQANTMELGQLIQKAMEQNPVLEDLTVNDSLESETAEDDHSDDINQQMEDDWRELAIIEKRNQRTSSDDEARREFLYNSIVSPETLQQHLASQLALADEDHEIREIADELLGDLNDRGFFETDIEELAPRLGFELSKAERAKTLIQSLDPVGVGASDLRECLMLQLIRKGLISSLEYKIVHDHLQDLARHKFPQIARTLGTTVERVAEAAEHIAALNPDPGSAFDATSNPHVVPDVIIELDRNGDYIARLTNEFLPRLQINGTYKDMVGTLTRDQKARAYLRQNIRDGRTLIRAISQRQETILGIAELIIEKQSKFLDYGSRHLKPLTMNEVAEVIGVHATTVSRAVAGKYILTPHGLMEMRAFFATGYKSADGTEVSNAGVREAIQQLVDAEDASKPLSDSAIEKLLAEQGIKVARRTVAKYREQLNILPSHLRKKF